MLLVSTSLGALIGSIEHSPKSANHFRQNWRKAASNWPSSSSWWRLSTASKKRSKFLRIAAKPVSASSKFAVAAESTKLLMLSKVLPGPERATDSSFSKSAPGIDRDTQ